MPNYWRLDRLRIKWLSEVRREKFEKRAVDLKAIRNKLAHMESLSIEDTLNSGLI